MITIPPKITIITVVFNDYQNIDKTIESIVKQTYKNIEYIIIDGASTDGTIDKISKYEGKYYKFISEIDNGIYDAMNKGVNLSTGDWIIFINSGDFLYSNNTLDLIFSRNKYDDEFDVIYGNNQVLYPNEKKRINKAGNIKNICKGSQFSHQSTFTRSSLLKIIHFTNNDKLVADFRFFYKIYVSGGKFKYVDQIFASISSGGLSDRNRIDVIVGWWNIVDKNFKLNIYYLYKIFIEIIKVLVKKCIK
jgi:glycosyltransferase involved in cell wall biosynthesis